MLVSTPTKKQSTVAYDFVSNAGVCRGAPLYSIVVGAATDFELLDAWRQGDPEAGEQLCRRYYAAVLRFFELRSPAAEDLAQRTFLAAVEGRGRVRDGGSFRGYLFAVAHKQLLRQIARQQSDRRRARFGGGSNERTTTVSALMQQRQEQRILLAVLSTLKEEEQTIIMLHYWENLTSREIGEVLAVPTSTVTTRLSRARQTLRERVEGLATGRAGQNALQDLEGWTRSLPNTEGTSGIPETVLVALRQWIEANRATVGGRPRPERDEVPDNAGP